MDTHNFYGELRDKTPELGEVDDVVVDEIYEVLAVLTWRWISWFEQRESMRGEYWVRTNIGLDNLLKKMTLWERSGRAVCDEETMDMAYKGAEKPHLAPIYKFMRAAVGGNGWLMGNS